MRYGLWTLDSRPAIFSQKNEYARRSSYRYTYICTYAELGIRTSGIPRVQASTMGRVQRGGTRVLPPHAESYLDRPAAHPCPGWDQPPILSTPSAPVSRGPHSDVCVPKAAHVKAARAPNAESPPRPQAAAVSRGRGAGASHGGGALTLVAEGRPAAAAARRQSRRRRRPPRPKRLAPIRSRGVLEGSRRLQPEAPNFARRG